MRWRPPSPNYESRRRRAPSHTRHGGAHTGSDRRSAPGSRRGGRESSSDRSAREAWITCRSRGRCAGRRWSNCRSSGRGARRDAGPRARTVPPPCYLLRTSPGRWGGQLLSTGSWEGPRHSLIIDGWSKDTPAREPRGQAWRLRPRDQNVRRCRFSGFDWQSAMAYFLFVDRRTAE